mgnify:CR=1 FL=1
MRHCHKTIIVILYIAKGDDFFGQNINLFFIGNSDSGQNRSV